MDEYISREAVLEHLNKCKENPLFDPDMARICFAISIFIENMKAADVQPVKHGRWNRYETCSICGVSKSYFFYCTETGDWDGDWNYCPNCGAKMDADELEKEMSKIAEMEMAYGEYLND